MISQFLRLYSAVLAQAVEDYRNLLRGGMGDPPMTRNEAVQLRRCIESDEFKAGLEFFNIAEGAIERIKSDEATRKVQPQQAGVPGDMLQIQKS